MTELDESLALEPAGPGTWTAHADPRRQAMTGMYGGWTAAVLLKSVLSEADASGTPSALTVHFIAPVAPGSDVSIRTRRVGGGRSLAFWQAELAVPGTESTTAIATVVLARRKESGGFTDLAMPGAADPDSLDTFHPPGPFGQRSLARPVAGHPPFNQAATQSIAWVRETSARSLDYVLLAYLADNYAPRSWFKGPEPGPYATITMSVYFHASPAELSELGDDYILIEATGSRAESSTVGAHARLWSRDGVLLATTEQLGWFR